MKHFFTLLFILFCFTAIYGQNQGVVTGSIKDKNLQEGLIGVVITLTGPDTLNAMTDVNGEFNISAPVGRYNFLTY